MNENNQKDSRILEAALFTADEPLSVDKLAQLFPQEMGLDNNSIRTMIADLQAAYADHAVELVEVASGYRFQAKAEYAESLKRLWDKRPARYSRALMETLALIAYRQPITRGEIEDVRGVVVSSQTMKTLMERDWIKIVGSKDVPGKPALFGTTRAFLDYFNLKKLSDLPPLSELVDFESLEKQLGLQFPSENASSADESDAMSESIEQEEELALAQVE